MNAWPGDFWFEVYLQFLSPGAASEGSGDENTEASVLALKELTLLTAAQHEIMKLKEVINVLLRLQLDSLIGFVFVTEGLKTIQSLIENGLQYFKF